MQPIVGCQMDLAYATAAQVGGKVPPPRPIVLLAQNEAGYLNLMKLNSCAFLDSGDQLPHITLEELAKHSEGLICLTGGALGPIGQLVQDGQHEAAKALMMKMADMFADRLYVELQRHPHENGRGTPAEMAT